jgi:hypothetical protein
MRRLLRNPNAFWVINALAGGLPGVIAACHLTAVLFYLNGDLPLGARVYLRGLARYGTLLGAASFLLFLALTRGDARRLRRALPWVLGATLLAVGVVERVQAESLALYVERGLQGRLAVAALWTTLASLAVLVTAALHTGRGRGYGARSRIGLLLFAALSVYAVLERRVTASAALPPTNPTSPALAATGQPPRLVLVGVESATLDDLLPLAEQGHLPFLRTLLREGGAARVASFTPVRRAAHWTTVATGRWPRSHAIRGPRQFAADFLAPGTRLGLLPTGISFDRWGLVGAGSTPTTTAERRAPALWDVLSRAGVATVVVAWPVSAPPTPGPLVTVTDRFFAGGNDDATVRPAEFAARLRLFREQPSAGARGALPDDASEAVVRALAGDRWRQEVFLRVLEETPEARAGFLHLPGLLVAQRNGFGAFSAVSSGSTEAQARAVRDVLVAYLSELDGFLSRLWRRLPEGSVLVIVSPHGIEAPRGLRALEARLRPSRGLQGRVDNGPDGVLLLLGAGVRGAREVSRIESVDVAPTLFYRLGLPVARDLDGGVRTELLAPDFLARQPLTFVPSYEIARGE